MSELKKSERRREEVSARIQSPSKATTTRNAILETASLQLQTRPFRDLTIGPLMRDAGYSRSTFYQYFTDLHDLMDALLDGVRGGIIEAGRPWLVDDDDPVRNLRASLAGLVEVGRRSGVILRAVADAAPTDERLERVWESFLASFDDVIAARILRDQKKGLIPGFDPLPVARALNRMDAALLIEHFGRGGDAGAEALLSALVRIWLSTLYPTRPLDPRKGPG